MQDNVSIANEPAYQLVLKPKDHRSLIGRVVIAVDAKYGMPLRVQVFAKGDSGPAFQVGYTQLSMNTAPAAANLNFTPPPGASVDKVNMGQAAAERGRAEAGHERLRHLRHRLAHRGFAAAARPSFITRNGRGRL